MPPELLDVFGDVGRTTYSNAIEGQNEFRETLVSTGLGLELSLFENNVNVSGYWGVALVGTEDSADVSAGSSQFWLTITLLY